MITAELLHRLPGRLRLRAEQLCGRSDLLRRIEQDLSSLAGIRSVAGSDLTGSVLIEYEPGRQSEDKLRDRLRKKHDVDVADRHDAARASPRYSIGTPTRLAEAVQYPFSRVDRALFETSGGYFDLRYTLPVAFIAIGTFRMFATAAQPAIPWYMFYWMSFRLFTIFRMLEGKDRSSGETAK